MYKKLLALCALPLAIGYATPYIPSQRCPGDISIAAEWIYFSPTSETRYFALQNAQAAAPINGTRQAVCFDDFHSGYRVGAAYSLCQCDAYVSLTWTSLKASRSRSLTDPAGVYLSTDAPPVTVAAGTFATSAVADQRFRYYAIDGIVGAKALCNCCISTDLFAGVHYAHFQARGTEHLSTVVTGGATALELTNTFWGVGPEVGINTSAPIWCGLALVGNASGGLIVGNPRSSVKAFGNSTSYIAANERCWRLVPYFDLRLGLSYDFSLPCCFDCVSCCFPRGFRGSFAVGYEAISYSHALSTIRSIGSSVATGSAVAIDDHRNVTMHGPYVAASLNF